MGFRTIARRAEHEETIKASRFVAVVVPLVDQADVDGLLAERRAAMPDANHHVWAWRWGDVMRWSDDGEPGGSAGRPALEVVLKRDLDRVAAVVTRYFGGTKLGAGGLARAYGGCVARALDAAGVREVVARERWLVRVPYGVVDALLRAAHDDPAVLGVDATFDARGPAVALEIVQGAAEGWVERLADLSRGQATIAGRSVVEAGGV